HRRRAVRVTRSRRPFHDQLDTAGGRGECPDLRVCRRRRDRPASRSSRILKTRPPSRNMEALSVKFGLSTLGCPDWTLERVSRAAIELGYDVVELRRLDGEIITPALLKANRGRLLSLFGSGKPVLIGLGTSIRFTS